MKECIHAAVTRVDWTGEPQWTVYAYGNAKQRNGDQVERRDEEGQLAAMLEDLISKCKVSQHDGDDWETAIRAFFLAINSFVGTWYGDNEASMSKSFTPAEITAIKAIYAVIDDWIANGKTLVERVPM